MGVYRSPLSNLDNSKDVILTDLKKIQNPNHPTIIMGDINVDHLTKQQKKHQNVIKI